MKIVLKIASLFVSKPLGVINGIISTPGWLTYTGAIVIILPALVCFLNQLTQLAPLDLNDIKTLAYSECFSQIGVGLAAIGIRRRLPNSGKV